MDEELKKQALEYHRHPRPGKIQVSPTKGLSSQRDLALAYSPGVAAACVAIVENPAEAHNLTARGNLVAVVSNGTAVLGLGDIGPLAGKPVMEGKGVLFKKFADIDVFDLEIEQKDPAMLVEIIASLEPTFGGINLEDIKAPECFYVEEQLRQRMKIPVFHDDQHGTAIIVAAAIKNGLRLVGKDLASVKLVASGAGAAALACLNLLVDLGLPREHVWVSDLGGVVYQGRTELMDPLKASFAQPTDARSLDDIIADADVFLGLSAGNVLKPAMVAKMARQPLILALANPAPEILPEDALAVRPDALLATGRSDYPNQVNNVLCFPYIFRGALDVGATTITESMKRAAVDAIADLAMAEQSDVVADAYVGQNLKFGPDYLIPKPFDPRLIVKIAPAVARAAMEAGVATRPIEDFDGYIEHLTEFVYKSNLFMRPVFMAARAAQKRVVFCEGEEQRVLHAVQEVVDLKLAVPILIGRPKVIAQRIEQLGLRLRPGVDFELCNQEDDPRYREYWTQYHQLMMRRGVSEELAQSEVRAKATLIGALMVRRGEADALICGTHGQYHRHHWYLHNVLGREAGASVTAAMNALLLPQGNIFIADTYVNADPTPQQLAEITLMAAATVRKFGIQPKVALLSHSSFGTLECESARKMQATLALVRAQAPDLEVDGEMHGDAALSADIRQRVFPQSTLKGAANLLIMPNLDTANISFNLLKTSAAGGVTIGPILLGLAAPAHVLTPTATVRRLINMAALAAAGVS
ncbi:NADP-dependent malic enzyme [Chitiniphilus eburneus]|uniref:NADP-dependent malic enzyme n=1 Tax=Chitiniphilus eburneus TaxID=2571148 RepID=A0A4U0PWK9_9NEIS|nr:NADP-dependent malic enzyme [Chitiniphilus eburneus]TJZ72899.1 NADP-dependent malic enzyme [Chitiniphilus eburneus]